MADTDFEWLLSYIPEKYPDIVKEALRAGAAVIAAQMKRNLRGVIADKTATELVNAFGITPVGQDKNRNYNVHLGFDGYQQPGTGKFKVKGIPFQLIARSFESGAVRDGYRWRDPMPFARPAVQSTRQQAEQVMKDTAEMLMRGAVNASKNQK